MSVVPVDFQYGVNDLDVGVNESIIILLFCMPHDAYECPRVLLNVDSNAKIVIESDICGNVCFFALMTVSPHYWSPFKANDCVSSRYEQQKMYSNLEYPHPPPTRLLSFTMFTNFIGSLNRYPQSKGSMRTTVYKHLYNTNVGF